jgi:hypothetical protein
MPADPNEPDTFERDDLPDEPDAETPEADSAEQHAELVPAGDTPLAGRELDDADPADVAEQARIVETDEDDYR